MISIRFILSQILDFIYNETYLQIAILHNELKLPGSLHRTMQILSVHPFEKIDLHELLTKNEIENSDEAILTKWSCLTYNRTLVKCYFYTQKN